MGFWFCSIRIHEARFLNTAGEYWLVSNLYKSRSVLGRLQSLTSRAQTILKCALLVHTGSGMSRMLAGPPHKNCRILGHKLRELNPDTCPPRLSICPLYTRCSGWYKEAPGIRFIW